jgi:hypothetical protein
MNRPILFDAKQSREVLKAIRYGMDMQLSPVPGSDDMDWLKRRLANLRKHYLTRRAVIDEKRSAFGNVIFYQILKEKYADFDYRVDERGAPLSNLYDFKVDGRLPSLLTMLINDNVHRITEPERRYGPFAAYAHLLPRIEALFRDAMFVYPDLPFFQRFVEAVVHARHTGQALNLVSAICPDYSYESTGAGIRYTFTSVGVNPGLAGNKLLAIMPVLVRFLDELDVRYTVNLYGGDFESLAYDDHHSPLGVTRAEFIARVRQQIANIARALPVPTTQSFFFEKTDGECGWQSRHEAMYRALSEGDFGATGLDEKALDAVFATRLPLYREWFKGTDEQALRPVFLKQAAEYALMGEVYSQQFDHFVVLGVDHYRMAPFYSFVRPAVVIYRHTDYISEILTESEPESVTIRNGVGEQCASAKMAARERVISTQQECVQ